MSEDQGQVRDVELDAEAQARRRFALAQIRQYPDPVLRMEARPVEEFDADLGRLVERMNALMVDASGHLRSQSDYNQPVGPGFWNRDR